MNIKTMYLICHEYTEETGRRNPAVSRFNSMRTIERAMHLVEETSHKTEGAHFRFNCETSTSALSFLTSADKAAKKSFLLNATNGDIEIGGFAYHYNTFLSDDECRTNIEILPEEMRNALSVRTIVQNGVDGVCSRAVDYGCASGMKYLWVGLDGAAKSNFDAPAFFNWKVSAQGHVLTWVNDGWGNFNEMLCEGDDRPSTAALFDKDEDNVRIRSLNLRHYLEKMTSPTLGQITSFPVSVTGGYRSNEPEAFDLLVPFVDQWNALGLTPRLCIATYAEAFQALEAEMANSFLPTFTGEWSGVDPSSIMCSPADVRLCLNTNRLFHAMKRIPSYDPASAPECETEILRNLCRFNENSVPEGLGCQESKRGLLYAASSLTEALYQDNVKLYFNNTGDRKLYVYNGSDVYFSDYIRLRKTPYIARHKTFVDENTKGVTRIEYDGNVACLWVELAPGTLHAYHFSERPFDKQYQGVSVDVKTDTLGLPIRFKWNNDILSLTAAGDLFSRGYYNGLSGEDNNTSVLTEGIYGAVERTDTDHTILFTQRMTHPSLTNGRRVITVWKKTPRISVLVEFDRISTDNREVIFVKFAPERELHTAVTTLAGQEFEVGRGQLNAGGHDAVLCDGFVTYPFEHVLFCSKDTPVLSFSEECFASTRKADASYGSPVYACLYKGNGMENDSSRHITARFDIILTPKTEDSAAIRAYREGLYLPIITNNTLL